MMMALRNDCRRSARPVTKGSTVKRVMARIAAMIPIQDDSTPTTYSQTRKIGEYAKRNRNADTRMVLDAVARIEESLAAQRQPVPESGLAEALAAIRRALEEARAAASAALDSLALEENLAPVRKGARVIREIAWRLREIGADGRICDLIDSQLSVIQAGCGQISSAGPRAALSAAFDLIEERIEAFGDSDTIAAAEEAMPPPFPAEDTEVATSMPAEVGE